MTGVCGAANLGPQGNNIGLWAMDLDKSAYVDRSRKLLDNGALFHWGIGHPLDGSGIRALSEWPTIWDYLI